jgi:Mg2+ and Co2+ transporter CorA
MTVKAFLFDAEGQDRSVEATSIPVDKLTEEQLLWINIHGDAEQEIEQIGKHLKLDSEVVKMLKERDDQPHLEQYEGYFHLSVLGVAKNGGDYHPVPLDLVSGKNYVLTVQHEEATFLQTFDDQVRGNSRVGQLTAVSFLISLIHLQLSGYFDAASEIEDALDQFDERVLGQHTNQKMLGQLTGIRRRVTKLRHLLASHSDAFAALVRPEAEIFFPSEVQPHVQALNTRFERALDTLENTRQSVVSSFDLLMTQTAQYTNDVMKTLTIVTVVIGLGGVIAGILGMNFQTPISDSGMLGFVLATAGIVIVGVSVVALARWRGWF